MNQEALYKISYGMYIISSRKDEAFNGQVANVVFQVTSNPPQVAVCVNKSNLTCEYISASRVFAVSVLSVEATMTFIGKFGFKSGRDIDKMQGTATMTGKTGVPIVTEYALAYLEAEVTGQMDIGTHILFTGTVVDAGVLSDREPMTYAYYHQVKKGVSPKTAPTFNPAGAPSQARTAKEAPPMKKYRCTVCGYIYDPEKGDPDSGVFPGTPFEQVPENWVCPVCGAPKSAFEPLS